MHIDRPVLRDLLSLNIPEGLKKYRWAIGVPRIDGLYWSVMMSVLVQATSIAERNLISEFLIMVTNEEVEESEVDEVMEIISGFNPFLDSTSCFPDETLKHLVKKFNDCATAYHRSVEYTENSEHEEVETQIDVIAQMLQTEIILVTEMNDDQYRLTSSNYICYTGSIWLLDREINILLYGERCNNSWRVVAFGLKLEHGNKYQKDSLDAILKLSEIDFSKELNLQQIKNNFLVSLLIGERFDELEELLHQPTYILDMLQDAGFPTNPITKTQLGDSEEEHSAFYYVLKSDKTNLLYLLYKYSIRMLCEPNASVRNPKPFLPEDKMNNITIAEQSGPNESVRNPNSFISDEKMSKISKALSEIESNSTDLRDLMNFNEFQSETCKWLLAFQSEESKFRKIYEKDEKKLTEDEKKLKINAYISNAEKLKTCICKILESYIKKFHIRDNLNERYENYMRFYRILDHEAACLYFDRSFYMRRSAKLDEMHEQMDSRFLCYILICRNYFNFLNDTIVEKILPKENALNCIPFTCFKNSENLLNLIRWERKNFEKYLNTFVSELLSIVIDESNVRLTNTPYEKYTLTSSPDVKENLIITRLKNYLDLVESIDHNDGHLISRLVIEKAVVVLGDAIKLSEDEPTTAKALLFSILPQSLCDEINVVRNAICHCIPEYIDVRRSQERNGEIYQKIKENLKKIEKLFEPVFSLQELKIKKYLLRNALNCLEQNQPNENELNHTTGSYNFGQEQNNHISSDSFEPGVRSGNELLEMLTSELNVVEQDLRDSAKSIVSNVFILLSRLEPLVSEDDKNDFGNKDQLVKIRCLLRCIKCLLEYIIDRENSDAFEEEKNLGHINDDDLKIGKVNFQGNYKFIHDRIKEYKKVAEKIKSLNNSNNRLNENEKGIIGGLKISLLQTDQTNDDTTDNDNKYRTSNEDQKNKTGDGDDKNDKTDDDEVRKDRTLEFFVDRVKKMEKILISDNDYFRNLWPNVKGSNENIFALFREKLASLYCLQPKLQASLEVLLLDCLDILCQKKTELNHLWFKRSYLFTRINLRNIFDHSDPLFEAACKVLDPLDIPNDVLNKALELIKDYEAVYGIYRLQQQGFQNLRDRITKKENNEEYSDIYEKIVKCGENKWGEYVKLTEKTKTIKVQENLKEHNLTK